MSTRILSGVVMATSEEPIFSTGDCVTISMRFPVGHYRVPQYIRGKTAVIEAVMKPRAVNNEEEGYGRNAGQRGTTIEWRFCCLTCGPVMPDQATMDCV